MGRFPARIAALLLPLLTLLSSSVSLAEDHASVRYPGSGAMTLHDGDTAIDAVLMDTRFDLDVRGLLAELRVEQTFRNTTERWLNGRYLFPMPGDAAIRGLELRIGERTVVGRIMEKDDARETFETARENGQAAGLVEQLRPNLFTADVANIAPGAEIHVELDVLLVVKASERQLSLTLPTTLTPRYAGPGVDARGITDSPILPARFITGPALTLNAQIQPLTDLSLVSSPSHRFDVMDERLVLQDAPMDRDLILQWPLPDGNDANGWSEGVADTAFVASKGNDRYAQIFMSPLDEPTSDKKNPPRELILVIDKSGSMAGISMEAAREAVQGALDALRPEDRFELIAFDDKTRALFGEPRAATKDNLSAARRFVRRLQADGGTEMGAALAQALRLDTASTVFKNDSSGHDAIADSADTPQASGLAGLPYPDDIPDTRSIASIRQVVFLTDGSIAEDDKLLRQIKRDIGRSRLFTVGIGSAPNDWFLDKASEIGGGTSLTIRDIDDVADSVSALLGRLQEPVLTDITVQFPGGAESYPRRIPDLYADSPLMVVAQLQGTGTDSTSAIITGWQGERRFRREIALPAPATTVTAPGMDALPPSATVDRNKALPQSANVDRNDAEPAPALAMHWARAKVDTLLDEQRHSVNNERHRDAITRLALDVGLITPYTSFVAVDDTPVRAVGEDSDTADVANLMPAGNTMLAIQLPQGAAGMDSLALLGLLSGVLGILSLRASRRLADPT